MDRWDAILHLTKAETWTPRHRSQVALWLLDQADRIIKGENLEYAEEFRARFQLDRRHDQADRYNRLSALIDSAVKAHNRAHVESQCQCPNCRYRREMGV